MTPFDATLNFKSKLLQVFIICLILLDRLDHLLGGLFSILLGPGAQQLVIGRHSFLLRSSILANFTHFTQSNDEKNIRKTYMSSWPQLI